MCAHGLAASWSQHYADSRHAGCPFPSPIIKLNPNPRVMIWPFVLGINAWWDYISTDFDVDSSSHFPFRACTDRRNHRSNWTPNTMPSATEPWTHTNLIKVQVLRYKPTETGQEVCCQEPFHVRPGVLWSQLVSDHQQPSKTPNIHKPQGYKFTIVCIGLFYHCISCIGSI